jgi:hypothetical protein
MGATPEQASRTVGGRAVLDEAVQVAVADLESGGEFAPIVVTKDWGDCQVERFGEDELERARMRMQELLRGAAGAGHCALAHLGQAGSGATAIAVELGRMGACESEAFVQHFRPRRGRFRPFKLIGGLVPAPDSQPDDHRHPTGRPQAASRDTAQA